jgi:hypothetical protein
MFAAGEIAPVTCVLDGGGASRRRLSFRLTLVRFSCRIKMITFHLCVLSLNQNVDGLPHIAIVTGYVTTYGGQCRRKAFVTYPAVSVTRQIHRRVDRWGMADAGRICAGQQGGRQPGHRPPARRPARGRRRCRPHLPGHRPGRRDNRPGLTACLGDTLVVWRLDRLGRDLRHLVNTVHDLTT